MTGEGQASFLQKVRTAIARSDVSLDAASDAFVERQVLVFSSFAVVVGAVFWSVIYLSLQGQLVAAAVPFGFAAITAVTFVIAVKTDGFGWYRELQFALVLILPFLLMTILGGFVPGSAVIIWALLTPVGALLSAKPHRAVYWFLGYVALVMLSVLGPDLSTVEPNLDSILIPVMFGVNLATPTAIMFLVVRKFVEQRDVVRVLLQEEQAKSENLLLNVLPEQVAHRLKENADTIAENYDSVSVLFADIVGFMPIFQRMGPQQMVDMLNLVFSHFDEMAAQFSVEKIRTIGDNYMVASGLPQRRSDHATALADMAIAIRDYEPELPEGMPPIVFRIGINSGPVVAGVIGTSRYQYDIWGDTVNTASRMESHGVPGQIQISDETKKLIEDEFDVSPRGTIEVKGKPDMETWILNQRV